MSKKKICFIVSSFGTVQAFLLDHFEHLSKDYRVYLVGNFLEEERLRIENLNLSGYKSIQINRKINLNRDLASLIKLRKYFKKEKFFATHSVTPKAGLVTALASRLAGVPHRIHIFTGQVWHTRTGIMKLFLILIDRIIAILNNHILVDGEPQRQFLINYRILKASKSFVLGKGSICGVNIAKFQPKTEVRLKLRNELNVNNKIVFGFLGRLNKDKGIRELYTAFNKLVQQNLNVHLLFIGNDEDNMLSLMPSFKNIKEGLNFTNYGYTSKPEDVLQVLDVFCLPSHREGFATSVLEASCLEIPVICSDTYGLLDDMIDGVTGLRHRVNDSNDLFEQMLKMAESEKLRKDLGQNGRNYVIENFSGETIAKEWVRFYKSLT